ncbi:MAG: hypothetical protein CMH81_04690 [Nitrospiraceae bacterium]|nr:hypothetical protein [Nitrospiraceae bacterium]
MPHVLPNGFILSQRMSGYMSAWSAMTWSPFRNQTCLDSSSNMAQASMAVVVAVDLLKRTDGVHRVVNRRIVAISTSRVFGQKATQRDWFEAIWLGRHPSARLLSSSRCAVSS